MATIVITSKDAERIAKSFGALVGPKGRARMRRKTVNSVGSDVRRGLRTQGPPLFGTSQAALSVRGKAAGPSERDPAYRLRMARAIPVARLRAKHRRIEKKAGRQSLTIDTPATNAVRFGSVERVAIIRSRAVARALRRRRTYARADGVRSRGSGRVFATQSIEAPRRARPADGDGGGTALTFAPLYPNCPPCVSFSMAGSRKNKRRTFSWIQPG